MTCSPTIGTVNCSKRRLSAILIGILVVFLVAAFVQGQAVRDEVQQHFSAALKYYEQGEHEKAAVELDQVIELSPTSEEALILREKAGMDMLIKLLLDPRFGPAARDILHKASEEAERITRDPATTERLVEETGSEDLVTRWRAIRQLIAIGPFAVPYLLDQALVNEPPSTASRMVAARIALRDMRSAGVPPLIVALQNAEAEEAMGIMTLLGKNPDARAVPVLAAIAQDKSRAYPLREKAALMLAEFLGIQLEPLLKDDTAEAAAKGKSAPPPKLPGAADAALGLALRYYYNDPTLVEVTPPHERVLWRWKPAGKTYAERLVFEEVPAFAFVRAMTNETLLAGIRHQQEACGKLLELYVCNNYMRLDEAIAAGSDLANDFDVVHTINEALGAKYLYRALGRALEDGSTGLAMRCIEALREIGDGRAPEGENTLVGALVYPDKFVRAAAAETLIHLSPSGELGGLEDVVRVLATGLGASAREIVVILSTDTDLLEHLYVPIRSWNMVPRTYADSGAALGRVKSGVPLVSLLIVDTRVHGIAVPVLIQSIKQDPSVGSLPIILIARKAEVDKLQQTHGGDVVAVLPVLHEVSALKTAIESGLASARDSASAADVRENTDLLRRVLRSAASLPPGTRYPAGILAGAAATVLTGYPDDIRILALDVIANLPDPALRDRVLVIFADEEESAEVRQHAGDALTRLLVVNPDLDPPQRAMLRKMSLGEPEAVLARQAVHALAIGSVPRAEQEQYLLGIEAEQ